MGIRCGPPFRWRIKSPATVGGESFFSLPLGFVRQSLGRRKGITTHEPGDLPEHVILRRAGRASSAVVTGELSSGLRFNPKNALALYGKAGKLLFSQIASS
jgi:hypothetical protein